LIHPEDEGTKSSETSGDTQHSCTSQNTWTLKRKCEKKVKSKRTETNRMEKMRDIEKRRKKVRNNEQVVKGNVTESK
jgi:hypothetical protein